MIRTSTVFAFATAVMLSGGWGQSLAAPGAPTHYLVKNKTPINMTIVGRVSLAGQPAKEGVEVAVFDAQGTLCGASGVDVANGGSYILQVYGDDPTTAEDEGAVAGDELRLEVYDPPRGPSAPGQLSLSSAGFNEPPAFPPKFEERASYGMNIAW
ncbi:MAG: hypothetical protein HZB55_17100 [Deltaproteobacteria bacterium]|nr:hypothetical protein [Deltaproteobacteria bacterium]